MTLFTPFSSTGVWVGYQVLAGVGRGITLQQPILAVQQNLEPSKIPIGVAMVVFCQFFGGALSLALADTDLSSSLRSALSEYAPNANATLIFNAGATGLRAVIAIDQLPGVLLAYNKAIINTFVSFIILPSEMVGYQPWTKEFKVFRSRGFCICCYSITMHVV